MSVSIRAVREQNDLLLAIPKGKKKKSCVGMSHRRARSCCTLKTVAPWGTGGAGRDGEAVEEEEIEEATARGWLGGDVRLTVALTDLGGNRVVQGFVR